MQPTYVSKFVCDGAACNSKCCSNWHIQLDEAAYERFAAAAPDIRAEIMANLEFNKESGRHEIAHRGGCCSFVREDKLCKLQLRCGADFLLDVCAEYPRKTHLFPHDFTQRALCMTCPVAARLALTAKEPMTYEEVTFVSGREAYFEKETNEEAIEATAFFKLQKRCIAVLQDHALTLKQRMATLKAYLEAADVFWAEGVLAEKFDELPVVATDGADFADFDVIAMVAFLQQRAQDDDGATKEYTCEVVAALLTDDNAAEEEVAAKLQNLQRAFEENCLRTYGHIFENYLVNEFFIELYPCSKLGSFSHNFRIFAALFALAELFLGAKAANGKEITEEDVLAVINWLSVRTNHFVGYMDLISEFLSASQ